MLKHEGIPALVELCLVQISLREFAHLCSQNFKNTTIIIIVIINDKLPAIQPSSRATINRNQWKIYDCFPQIIIHLSVKS